MDNLIATDYYTTGKSEKDIPTSYTASVTGAVNKINLENNHYTLQIIMGDMIDVDETVAFLNKERTKVVLLCTMKKGDAEYSGKRKLLWKGDNVALSQGGIRIEFPPDAVEHLKKVAEFIQQSYKH